MNPARFFRQSVTLKRLTSSDAYAGSTYANPEVILARWTDAQDLQRDANGREITTRARVSTLASLKVGDVLVDALGRDREIVSVTLARDTRARESHTIARVA